MIVISNAFVFSTCLLVVVSRYGYIYKSFSRTFFAHLLPAAAGQKAKCCQKYIKIFPSFNPLGQFNKFRGRYFNVNTISLRRGDFPFSLLMPAFSLGIILLGILSLLNITNIQSKIYPTFCYPTNKYIYI
jgi:hypothetical protein